jgi:hypothetical protein
MSLSRRATLLVLTAIAAVASALGACGQESSSEPTRTTQAERDHDRTAAAEEYTLDVPALTGDG